MSIDKFSFVDTAHNWTLDETCFQDFNLLVGLSGVGKTRILSALLAAKSAGLRDAKHANGCHWTLNINAADHLYTWSANVSKTINIGVKFDEYEIDGQTGQDIPVFHEEKIVRSDGKVLVERTSSKFVFDGNVLPRLKANESAISLLKDEAVIAPLRLAIEKILFSQAPEFGRNNWFSAYNEQDLARLVDSYETLDDLKAATSLSVFVKVYILQERFKKEFDKAVGNFRDIFPTVEDVKIGYAKDFGFVEFALPSSRFILAIREHGVSEWIENVRLSSGMKSTMMYIFELAMVPEGTVIVIDEFENSLGVNCLQAVTDILQSWSGKVQFIVTSHHPYIIDNVPTNKWLIVTRNGARVTTLRADKIPALRNGSAQDKFIRLINLKEFEQGIQ